VVLALLDAADDFVCPAIPEYVDGSFLTVLPAGDQAAGQRLKPASTLTPGTPASRRPDEPAASFVNAGAPSASGFVKSTQAISLPIQNT